MNEAIGLARQSAYDIYFDIIKKSKKETKEETKDIKEKEQSLYDLAKAEDNLIEKAEKRGGLSIETTSPLTTPDGTNVDLSPEGTCRYDQTNRTKPYRPYCNVGE